MEGEGVVKVLLTLLGKRGLELSHMHAASQGVGNCGAER